MHAALPDEPVACLAAPVRTLLVGSHCFLAASVQAMQAQTPLLFLASDRSATLRSMLCAVERTMTWRSGSPRGRAEAPIACVQLEVCNEYSQSSGKNPRLPLCSVRQVCAHRI